LSKRTNEVTSLPEPDQPGIALYNTRKKLSERTIITLCALALILSILVSVAPLLHLAGKTYLLSIPTNPFLLLWGAWLPYDLHLTQPPRASMLDTNDISMAVLLLLQFTFYALSAMVIHRLPIQGDFKNVLRLIWLVAIVAGIIYVLTPSMLSRDIFVYIGYGRTIVEHHANPYFVPFSAFPQDPLTSFDDWRYSTAAYGPAWLLISSLGAFSLGTAPLANVLGFRLFGLVFFLFNTWLVYAILRKMGRSSRTVTIGTLLFAWNPLVLMESCLGGHNDIFMVTFILLGILLSVRAEQHNFARPVHYLTPIFVFTLAVLVKFTALPIVVIYLLYLARYTLYPMPTASSANQQKPTPHWGSMFIKLLLTCAFGCLICSVFYAPFFIGHSLYDIMHSFSTPPSSLLSENSLLRAIVEWIKANGLPAQTSWTNMVLSQLSHRYIWDWISYATLLCMLIIGAVYIWRIPTTRTMVLVALASFGVLLVITPWFFSWYVTWLVGLAAVSLSDTRDRLGRALLAFTLTFSATAFVSYSAITHWSTLSWLTMIGPPLLVFGAFVTFKQKPTFHTWNMRHTVRPT
jgi:hypothetical protein